MSATQNPVYDSAGHLVERTVKQGSHLVRQRRQADGGWWNIRVVGPVR